MLKPLLAPDRDDNMCDPSRGASDCKQLYDTTDRDDRDSYREHREPPETQPSPSASPSPEPSPAPPSPPAHEPRENYRDTPHGE